MEKPILSYAEPKREIRRNLRRRFSGALFPITAVVEVLAFPALFAEIAQLCVYVLERMPGRESIVLTSILAAIDGQYGNYQTIRRTADSTLYINPLMSIYFAFRLPAVAKRIQYLDRIRHTETYSGLSAAIGATRAEKPTRPRSVLPI